MKEPIAQKIEFSHFRFTTLNNFHYCRLFALRRAWWHL